MNLIPYTKKPVLFLTLLFTLAIGTLFAEKHTLGFAGLDVDTQGTNQTKVYYIVEGSPAAENGGFQMGDTILSIDGQDMANKYWRELPAYLKSDKPTTFTISVLRNNQTITLKITSAPASSLAGKKYRMADPKKLNPNLRDVSIPVVANNGRMLGDYKKIVNNEVFIKIRYAGETRWLYNKAHKLNSEGKLVTDKGNIYKVYAKLAIDYTRTLYIEMVYQYTDGFWYGDYLYKRGADVIWGNGYEKAKLMIWHTFKRSQSDPDWNEQLNRKIDIKGSRAKLFLSKQGYKYYADKGYIFDDEANITVLDVNGTKIFDKTIPVREKLGWDTGYWSITYEWSEKDKLFTAPNQIAEKDITVIYTINATQNGKPVVLSFKVRETLITGRNNQGMYRVPSVDESYYIDGNGQLTKLRLR